MFSTKFTAEALSKQLTAVVKTQISDACLAIGKAIEDLVMSSVEKGVLTVEFTIDVPGRTIIPGDAKDVVPKVRTLPTIVQQIVLTRVRDELVRLLGPNALSLYVLSKDGSGKFYRYPPPEPVEPASLRPVNGLGVPCDCTRCGRTGHVAAQCYASSTIFFGAPSPVGTTTAAAPPTGKFTSEGIKLNLTTFVVDI
jgi:hypothetical protein